MNRAFLVTTITLMTAASLASAQRININIHQRPDGGQSVSAGKPITNSDAVEQQNIDIPAEATQRSQSTRSPRQQKIYAAAAAKVFRKIQVHSHKVNREIENLNRILEKTNEQYREDFPEIMALPSEIYQQNLEMREMVNWLYLRCGSLYPTKPASIEACAVELDEIRPENAELYKYFTYWKMLIGDKNKAQAAYDVIQKNFADSQSEWLEFMGTLVRLAGQKCNFSFLSRAKKEISTVGTPVTIIVFHAGDDQSAKTLGALGRTYGRLSFCQLIDAFVPHTQQNSKPAPGAISIDARQAMDLQVKLGITKLPCAIVTDSSGQVLYAGQIPDWQLYRAIDHAIGSKDSEPIYETARKLFKYDQIEPQTPNMETSADSTTKPTQDSNKNYKQPSQAEEFAASQLQHEGWNKLRMSHKTHNRQFREEGARLLRQCIEQYPNTKAAEQAREDLKGSGLEP